jgi:tetratricopeptide (TPR) repeat protein
MRIGCFFAILALFIGSCSTQKNTRVSRGYHNLTARYNVYFNGNESFKSGERAVREAIEDDYLAVLPLFEYSNREAASRATSDMERAMQKGMLLIKKHSITKKPKRRPSGTNDPYYEFYNRQEFNRWVDDAYLLIGKSHFYKGDFDQAIQTFDQIIRDFSYLTTSYHAILWKASAFSEMGDFANARLTLESYDRGGEAPEWLYGRYMAVYADLLLKQRQYQAALPYLRAAVDGAANRQQKIRFRYILAQVCELTGNIDEARYLYGRVIKSNPGFEMAFNSRVNRASMVKPGAGTSDVKKQLNRMLRDKKNKDNYDRIYYALASVYLLENNEEKGVEYLRMSTLAGSSNRIQKRQSFLRLADIYFSRPQYKEAYFSYDSALLWMDPGYELHHEVTEKHQSLEVLVKSLDVYERNDSLMKLSKMSEPERLAIVDKIIADAARRKEEERKKEEMAMNFDPVFYQNVQSMQNSGGGTAGGKWYFYNLSMVGMGKMEFERKWGKRKLEDNWRRSNKSSQTLADNGIDSGEPSGFPGLPENQNRKTDDNSKSVSSQEDLQAGVMTRESLLKNIPMTDSARHESSLRIEEALLEMGMIYRDRFSDYQRSVLSLEELLKRFPNGHLREDAYTELYRSYRKKEDNMGMENTRVRLIQEFPSGKFAAFLNDPNYLDKLEERTLEQDREYEQTYRLYLQGFHKEVISKVLDVEQRKEENQLLPKYRLLKALAYAREGEGDDFSKELQVLISKHPNTEEARYASLYIGELEKGRIPVKSFGGNTLFGTVERLEASPADLAHPEGKAQWIVNNNGEHSLLIVAGAKADMNRMAYLVADYNFTRFLMNDYDQALYSLPDGARVLEVKGFKNADEAMDYFYSVRSNSKLFNVAEAGDVSLYVANEPNARYLISSGDVTSYVPFFAQNYLAKSATQMVSDVDSTIRPSRLEPELPERIPVVDGIASQAGFKPISGEAWVALVYETARVDHTKVLRMFENFVRTKGVTGAKAESMDFHKGSKVIVVKQFGDVAKAEAFREQVVNDPYLLRDVKGRKYHLIIVSGENFDVLLKGGTVEDYEDFYSKNK